jgi:GNAT superfamily N-acetyltransferase
MKVRAAVPDDAPAMGRVMVEAYLTAHRGQMPDAPWHKRVNEWTPEVSTRAWARAFAERARGQHRRDVVLVATDDANDLIALVSGTEADDDTSGSVAEIGALYVLPDRQGQGIGRMLLMEAGKELATLGFTTLHIGVLTANLPARGFYEAMGGYEIGQRTFDEEGYLLPETIYAWTDIAALAIDVRERS